jgi:hypothetical protein
MTTVLSDDDSALLMKEIEFMLTRTRALSQMVLYAAKVIANPEEHQDRQKLAADLRTIAEATIADVDKLATRASGLSGKP